jgi:hypothetical protein
MVMPDTPSTTNAQRGSRTSPADDLADVWDVLDSLPSANPPADLTATTVELVAAKLASDVGPKATAKPHLVDRLLPLAIIFGGLIVGVVAGRISAPDPDAKILERLPVIEHLSLLQELGSVEFLESLVAQMKDGQANPPRWLRSTREPSELRSEAQEFDATLVALRSEVQENNSSRETLARRREYVAALSPSELAALEKSASNFEALSALDRREYQRLAETLADPARQALHEAAKQWHVIVAAINPAFRRNIVEMSSAERLEWLARSAGRYEARPQGRPREEDRGSDRRPSVPRREGQDERPRPDGWPAPFQRPPPPAPNGGPPGKPPPGGPSIRAPGAPPPSAPRATPPEMREAPR